MIRDELLVSYRFVVIFMTLFPVDIRFQKVSGLSSKVDTELFYEGGDNVLARHLPNKVQYNNLSLEKGRASMTIDALMQINEMFTSFTFNPVTIIVSSLNEIGLPLSNWVLEAAYPVNWSVSDLDANANSILIDTLELAYGKLTNIKV